MSKTVSDVEDSASAKLKLECMYKICSPPIWAIYEGHVCYLKIIAEDIRKDALMMQLLSTVEVIEDPVLMMYSPIWGDYMDWDIRIERSMNNLSSE